MDNQIPVPLQWVLAVCTILVTIGYILEKLPTLRRYVKRRAAQEAARAKIDYWIGSLLALACAAIWAASFASLDLVTESAGTLQINIYLMGFAALFLYLGSVVVGRKERGRKPAVTAPWSSGRAPVLVFANLGNFLLSVLALSFITASEAIALSNLSPLFVALVLWHRGKLSPSLGTFLAVALVVLGTLIINLDVSFRFRVDTNVLGSIVAVSAGACFAVWTLIMDEIKVQMTSLAARMQTLALVFLASFVILVTLAYAGGGHPGLSTRDLLILAANGTRVAIVYLLFQFAVEKAGPLLTSVILVLMVPFTFPLDSIWNDAAISPQLIFGAALIVLATIGLLSDELQRARRGTQAAAPAQPGGPARA